MSKDKAAQFLGRAKNSLDDTNAAREKFSPEIDLLEQKRQWSLFLSEFRKTLKFLEQTARNLDRNEWADNLLRERKESPILNYLFHARNADEHGVVSGYETVPGALQIGQMFSFAGTNKNIKIENCTEITTLPDGREIRRTLNANFSTQDGKIVDGWINTGIPVTRRPPFILLGAVVDRGISYACTRQFLGKLGCSEKDISGRA